MSDDVFEKWKDSTVGLASIAFFDHAKEMEMRLNKAMFALRGIEPNLRGLLFDSDLILTMEFEEAIKAVLAVVDTPNPAVTGGSEADVRCRGVVGILNKENRR